MATTRLSDIIIPEVYQTYQAVDSKQKTAFLESGVLVQNEMLNQKANTGGDSVNIPFWNDLDASVDPNISTDNPADVATADKVTASKQIGRLAYLNKSYSDADLTGEIAGSDPMQQVRNRFGRYWDRSLQKRLISMSNGIIADNVANDASDMVVDVAAEATGDQTADTKFNRDVFTDAVGTAGDADDMFQVMVVHSAVYNQMRKNDDIDFIPDSEGRLTIPTYMGLRLIRDDTMTVTAGSTSGSKYTSIILGAGAFGYGEGTPRMPVEVEREASQGNGGGVDVLYERKSWLIHPFGFSAVAEPASTGYTNTELATATTWDRVVPRKNVPLAFLITN